MGNLSRAAGLVWLGLIARGCGDTQESPVASNPGIAVDRLPERLPSKQLPNALRLHARVISGGQPAGEAGFAELRALGVRTVISVDGARPEVSLARKHGLRYVHLPHGYDGVPETRAQELAKAVRELPGPIYIHCHHGKHRSPAAAAVACVGAGLMGPESALGVLKAAGTSPNYQGLYRAARDARQFEQAVLDQLAGEFPEVAALPPMADAMVAIEHTLDRLRACEKAGWVSPPDHPDLDPPHEALLLREHFAELLRLDEPQPRPTEFVERVRQSEQAAADLEATLRRWNATSALGPAEVGSRFARITQGCTACHQKFRDNPGLVTSRL